MENATKALLIAAAILIAIIIISFGIFVVRQGQEAVHGADLSEAEAAQFNAKFQMYEGEKVSGTRVNSLLNTIFIHNQQEKTAGTARYVETDGEYCVDETLTQPQKLSGTELSDYYDVQCVYTRGIVTMVYINK